MLAGFHLALISNHSIENNVFNSGMNIVQKHKVQHLLNDSEIEELSNRFEVSAGVIDQAIRKVAESRNHCDEDLKESVVLALESHISLSKGGHSPTNRSFNYNNFILDGLNLSGTDHS